MDASDEHRPPDCMSDWNDEGLPESCCLVWSEMDRPHQLSAYPARDVTFAPATFMQDDEGIDLSPLSLAAGAGKSTLSLLFGVDYDTTYSAPEGPLDCVFYFDMSDDKCRPTTPIHGMVPGYCCYCVTEQSSTATTDFGHWLSHTKTRGYATNERHFPVGKAFERFMDFYSSQNRLGQRTRPTPQLLPGYWIDSVDKNNTTAATNVGSWLRTDLPREMHTHEPPFYKVYPRLSDPPIDN